MYSVVLAKRYRKSLRKLQKDGNFDIERLNLVIKMLVTNEILPRAYLDHQLTGELGGLRECHVQNDVLLLYQIRKGELILVLVNIGSHLNLFGD